MSDDELRQWQSQWRQPTADLIELLQRARRDDRRHRLIALAEYLATGLLLAGSLGYACLHGGKTAWLWAGAIWVLGIPALLFAVWNRRGLGGNAHLDTHQRLHLSLHRCRHGLRALHVSYVLLFVSSAVVLAFALGVDHDSPERARIMLWILAALVVAHLVVMAVIHLRLRRRLRTLEHLRHRLDETSL